MRLSSRPAFVVALATVMLAVAGCSSTASTAAPAIPSTLPTLPSSVASSLPSNLPSSLPPSLASALPSGSVLGSAAGALQVAVNAQSAKGPFLVGPDGKTLYVFSKDTATTSACEGQCAQTWPPVTLPAGASLPSVAAATGTFATITRSDGSMQLTYKGHPLYTYSGDSKPGDTNGDGVGGVWSVAKA